MEITVDCGISTGPLSHFWRSTGFTPADWMAEPAMEQAIAYLGSIPNGGLRHVRIHYLLDLVDVRGIYGANPEYDWSQLDAALDRLVRHDLAPFFEIMGNPSNVFDDFTDPEQVRAWRRLVRDLATHLVDRYGKAEVESWYFESWNEPDIGFGWPQFKYNIDAFEKYYDACDAGLRDADGEFTFGGPGTSGSQVAADEMTVFRSLMAHCDTGTNHLTGESPRIDFVSVHEKGVEDDKEELSPDTAGILERELAAAEYLAENHPSIADRPVSNNECDPQTGWNTVHTWRARPYYAAIVAKMVYQHVTGFQEAERNNGVLSPDNGFLGSWGHRTHFAQIGDDERNRGAFDLIKKPVHNVMTILALLGDTRLDVHGPSTDEFGFLATRAPGEVAVLVTQCHDAPGNGGETEVDIELTELPFSPATVVEYRIDRENANPYAIWADRVAPGSPQSEDLAVMRAEQELPIVSGPSRIRGDVTLSRVLSNPSVSLFHVVEDPGAPPAAPTGLTAETHSGTTFGDDAFLSWTESDSRAIATYEVLWRTDSDEEFQRVNDTDLIATAWIDAGDGPTVTGQYVVRAVDYWGRESDHSNIAIL